nr:aminotransferase class I/II-fold pyridoxal phosphate-dependent enzyme [Pedobacter sp. ASV19]
MENQPAGKKIGHLTRDGANVKFYPLPPEFFIDNSDAPQIGISGEKVLYASEEESLIDACFKVLCGPGDVVVYTTPDWHIHNNLSQVEALGKKLETEEEHHFLPVSPKLRPLLKDAALLCLCSPANPVGALLKEDQLQEIIAMILDENKRRKAHEKKIYLFFDAMYARMLFRNDVLLCYSVFSPIKEYTIYAEAMCRPFSSTEPFRIVWCRGPEEILQKMESVLSEKGTLLANPADQRHVGQYIRNIKKYNSSTYKFQQSLIEAMTLFHVGVYGMKFNGYPVQTLGPSFFGGLYLALKIDIIGKRTPCHQFLNTAKDISSYLQEKTGIEFFPFSRFGCASTLPWFSLNIGQYNPDEIPSMIKSLQSTLEFAKGFGLYSGI